MKTIVNDHTIHQHWAPPPTPPPAKRPVPALPPVPDVPRGIFYGEDESPRGTWHAAQK